MEREMDAELRWHFDQYVQHLIASGHPAEEARRRARLELGDIEVQKDQCRDSLGLRFLDEIAADFRFALRSLNKHRILSINVVLTLALGIGISAGVFTFLDAMALRPLVAKNPNSFIQIFSFFTMDATRPPVSSGATLDDFLAYRDKARSLRLLTAWQAFSVNFESDHLTVTNAALVSENFFPLFGLEKAQLGRLLQPGDYAHSSPVIVLSEYVWQNRFASDPRIVGKTIHVNDQPVTVVGVVPQFATGRNWAEAWLPYSLSGYLGLGDQWAHPGEEHWLEIFARLNPGYSQKDAAAELSVLAAQQDKLHKGRISSLVVTNGSEIQEPDNARLIVILSLFMSILLMVLFVSCANVATLLLSRADARQQEMGVRLALGARRVRLIRMLLTETLLLACVAGAASIYLMHRVPRIINGWFEKTPVGVSFAPDWRVFSYFAGSILLVGLLAGLAPALESLKVDLLSSLKGRRRPIIPRGKHWNLRNLLVAAQIAISLVLLVGASLFVTARHRVLDADPGFDTHQVLFATVFDSSIKTPEARAAFRDELIRKIEAIPGVRSAAFTARLPFTLSLEQMVIQLPGKSAFSVATSQVSDNYFATLGIPILRGRGIERADAACAPHQVCPVVVSQDFAREYLNSADVLGKTLRTPDGETLEIVGLSGNVASAPFSSQSQPVIYRAWPVAGPPLQVPLSVRVSGDANAMSKTLAAVIRQQYPNVEIDVKTMHSLFDRIAQTIGRFNTLIEIPGMLAVVLAAIGIYGVVSFAVSKRTKEMGIRIAMGATRKDIYAVVIRSSLRPVWLGLLAGLLFALAAARFMQHRTAEFLPLDYYSAFTYAAPVSLMLAISLLAMLIPARRAARCDPGRTLREE
jgi:predicted permease